MNVIDLTQTIYEGMPVYPGDPEVKIEKVQTIETEGWDLQTLYLSSHLGTHVNMPAHMVGDGKTLDDFPLERFWGKAVMFNEELRIKNEEWTGEATGFIFREQNIDQEIAEWIIMNKNKILFVGLSEKYEFDLEVEKKLLQHEIISFENLANCDQLPEKFIPLRSDKAELRRDSAQKSFTFYGLPLKIKEGNGSPVRAIAIVNEEL